jgi:4-hydroxy-2-oxoheptanedioate aldolase
MRGFKTRLEAGETLFGLWSTLSSPNVAELLGGAGFDWLLFDAEHSPVELSELVCLLRAAQASSANLAVRIPWNDAVMIKRALDLGVETLFVPFVQNAAEAQAVVSACRYPPAGRRGVAGATRASGYGRDKRYLKEADKSLCIIVQVETPEAVSNLEDISSVDGIDGVFVGPSDLSASMGYLGKPMHPDVQATLRACIERLAALEMPAGILATDAETAKHYANWGYRFIAAGVDAALLARATDQLLDDIRT